MANKKMWVQVMQVIIIIHDNCVDDSDMCDYDCHLEMKFTGLKFALFLAGGAITSSWTGG